MTTHLATLRDMVGDDRLTAAEVAAVEEAIRLADGVRWQRQACQSEACGRCAARRACEALSEMEQKQEE